MGELLYHFLVVTTCLFLIGVIYYSQYREGFISKLMDDIERLENRLNFLESQIVKLLNRRLVDSKFKTRKKKRNFKK